MLENFYRNNQQRHVKTISTILKFNKDLAEDIVQQAYMKALQHEDSYDSNKGTYNAWFNKILFNVLKTYQKDFGNTVSLNEDMVINDESLEYLILLDREIQNLKNKNHTKVLDLFYRNGYTINEIISLTGLTKTNITTICNRFKSLLVEKYKIRV